MPDNQGAVESVRLTNFRRFADTGAIRLAPVTLVLGKNSSGKTSLLRSLLLVKQLMSAPTFEDVPLAGPYVDFGSYRELVFDGELSRDVSIELTIRPDRNQLHFPTSLINEEVEELLAGLRLHLDLHWNKRQGKPQFTNIKIESLRSDYALNFTRRGPESFIFESPGSRHTVPFPLTFTNLRRLPLDAGFTGAAKKSSRGDRRDYTLFVLMDAISDSLGSVRHVGPLRDMPDRAYRIDQLSPDSPTASVVNLLERQKQAQATMSEALRELGMARDVSLSALAPGYVGIVLTDPRTGRVDNLTDVGFGVSQVLPVIAALATAGKSATVLVEQPELHLHPDAQGRLADVLVRLRSARGVSAVVETHSEHILLRVLRRVAEGTVAPEDVSVVVVDGGNVRNLGIDRLGRLTNGSLPTGFFEEDWEDTMLLAKAAAKKASEA
jgi:predicted ATPase